MRFGTLLMMILGLMLASFAAAGMLTLRAMIADREVLSTTGDLIVLFVILVPAAFVTVNAMHGAQVAGDARAKERAERAARASAAKLVSTGAMSPNEARGLVVNLSDHRKGEQ